MTLDGCGRYAVAVLISCFVSFGERTYAATSFAIPIRMNSIPIHAKSINWELKRKDVSVTKNPMPNQMNQGIAAIVFLFFY